MSTRAYIVLALVVIVIGLGIVLAEVQRAAKTAELLEDLDHDSPDVAIDTMADLVERGSSIEGELLELLSGSIRRKERMRAAVLLGRVGAPATAGPALVNRLTDDWPPVRRAAVLAIGQLGYLDGAQPLIEIVKDEEQEMDTRSEAVKAVGLLSLKGLGEDQARLAVRPLVAILDARPDVLPKEEAPEEEEEEGEEEGDTEDADEEAVIEEDPPIAVEAAPADKEIEIRRQCVLALGLIGATSTEGLTALFASADATVEPAALVRQAACMAIEDLGGVPSDAGLARAMASTLLAALDDDDADTRMFACRACTKHSSISENDLDLDIDKKLAVMAAELIEEGEVYYWSRQAAQAACSVRGVAVAEPNTSHETAG